MLGMDQSVGFFGSVGMLGSSIDESSTGDMAIALATGNAWLQAINNFHKLTIDHTVMNDQ